MGFKGKWIKVDSDIKNGDMIELLENYDNLITQYVDLVPMSAVLDSDDETMTQFKAIYKSTLGVCNSTIGIMINQDNMIRTLMDQNTENLKKLDKISEKTK